MKSILRPIFRTVLPLDRKMRQTAYKMSRKGYSRPNFSRFFPHKPIFHKDLA
jgi:hypothetical protein